MNSFYFTQKKKPSYYKKRRTAADGEVPVLNNFDLLAEKQMEDEIPEPPQEPEEPVPGQQEMPDILQKKPNTELKMQKRYY